MDRTEKLVADLLAHRGYTDVEYEPDGNVPPDFLVDGRIAVEVRRLNQHYQADQTVKGLEEVDIPLFQKIKKLALSFGPPQGGESWYLHYRSRRPVEKWQRLEPKLRTILTNFKNLPYHPPMTVEIGARFYLELKCTSSPQFSFYVVGSHADADAGGFIIAELARNLPLCIAEKTAKIAKVRARYPEWWLVLADHIGFGLGDPTDQQHFRQYISMAHNWDKIILVDPTNPTRCFEV